MKRKCRFELRGVLASLLVCVLGSAGALSIATNDHPITKVIGMLEGLRRKATEEGKAEALTYEKFDTWCKVSLKTLEKAIAAGRSEVGSLEKKVESKKRAEKVLTDELGSLKDELSEHSLANDEAVQRRKEGADLYATASADLTATAKACDDALEAVASSKSAASSLLLARHEPKVWRALSLAELAAPRSATVAHMLDSADRVIAGVMDPPAARPELKAQGDRDKHVKKYEFKSGSVVELLKGLKGKFEEALRNATVEETNAQNSHQLETQARQNLITAASASQKEKQAILGEVQADLADFSARLEDYRSDLKADSASRAETAHACTTKAQEWKERSKTRAGEIEAMEVATRILSKVTGVRTEAPSNPVPPSAPVLLQLLRRQAARAPDAPDARARAVDLLRVAARRTHAKALQDLAQEVSHKDPSAFGDVGNMIEKMIFRLMDEQKNEDDHKHWCDQEISKTEASQQDKSDFVEEHTVLLETAQAKVQQLAADVAEADAMVAELQRFMKESAEVRAVGKAENAAALKDSRDAQAAIAEAVAALKAFYKESGMIAKEPGLLQRSVDLPDSPATWDASYTGTADPQNQPAGIVAVLERSATEFARMEAETRAQEGTDQEMFDQETKDSEIEIARRAKESEMKAARKKNLVEKVAELAQKRKHAKGELEIVSEYMRDLQPACVGDREDTSTYEARKEARAQEVEALRKAQDLLANAFKPPVAPAKAAFLAVRRHT